MAEISLCMIVKNEERVLARCLESIKAAVDEIIIADTGSTDATKEIAKKYTDKIYDFEWTDNFSAARNFAFSKAEKEYIMWLDADDAVTPENCIKILSLKKELTADAVMMKYNTAFDENGNPVFSYYRERIVKKAANPNWRGRVHETIDFSGSTLYSNIEINHYSVKSQYSTRNLDIYEKQLQSSEAFTPRDKFYYGRELYYHKKYGRAIEVLNNFLDDDNGWSENKIEACRILSLCLRDTGKPETAAQALFRSFCYDSPRAEVCCDAGSLFMLMNRYSLAAYWYELALTVPINEESGGFIDFDSHGYIPCIQLCVCYYMLKDYKKSEEYNKQAGIYRPASAAYIHNLDYFKNLHQSNIL